MTVNTKVKLEAEMKTKEFAHSLCQIVQHKKKQAFQNKLLGEGTHWRGSKEKGKTRMWLCLLRSNLPQQQNPE